MKTVNTLIADDHKIIRDGIMSLLRDEKTLKIVAQAGNGAEVLEILKIKAIDLIIMDISMPILDGIETTKKVKKLYPETKVLILSMYDEENYVSEVFKSGASGFILKNTGKAELTTAIASICANKPYFSSEITQTYLNSLSKPEFKEPDLKSNLSEREIEVLRLIVGEYSNQEIAEILFISVRTVDAHRRNLINKTESKTTAGLVKFAILHNLVEVE
ncbi:MAG: response regulator transcription factor [Bacteroidales bacterium]|nr:response regulator transcription factor [Bacteroidota bacterium]MCF8347842.1 response regulator transcription factor [Bacteroidales bacterium]